jgi:hypothetical protein
VSTTSVAMLVQWQPPLDDGGCPITGYALFRDDGTTEIPSIEVNTPNDPLVRNIPTLQEVSVTLLSSELGLWYTYQLFVFNSEGQT